MADEPIQPRKTGTAESTRGEATKLGCIDVVTPQGPVHFHDAPGFMTTVIERPGVATSIGVLSYDPAAGQGMVVQLDGDSARTMAASLLRLADEIDPRRPN
jgi:ABC-type amino acid transport substrate-binding protein